MLPTRAPSGIRERCGMGSGGTAVSCELVDDSAILLVRDILSFLRTAHSCQHRSQALLATPLECSLAFWSSGTFLVKWLSQTMSPHRRQWCRRKNHVKVCRQIAHSAAETSGFQCAVVGGPDTSCGSSSMPSLAARLRFRLSRSISLPWKPPRGRTPTSIVLAVACDFPLSKLLSLLAGGVSGARGRPGMSVGRAVGSVGRSAAGMYIGCRGWRSWRTLMCGDWRLVGEMFADGGVCDIVVVYAPVL